jgi:hypothetical protein
VLAIGEDDFVFRLHRSCLSLFHVWSAFTFLVLILVLSYSKSETLGIQSWLS